MKGRHVECGANADLIILNMHHDFITDADRQTLFMQIFMQLMFSIGRRWKLIICRLPSASLTQSEEE
ncbi:hypothetical protein [Thermoflavifilum aggregans]|uniref:hypothetical protein n=1 Tax=Thermoflavifilum aggregans TaxID=454188 RepID=UPI000C244AF0|nr:hypothetical protein [Thermoflavifilum aggregans]